jgi:hypothetical protein
MNRFEMLKKFSHLLPTRTSTLFTVQPTSRQTSKRTPAISTGQEPASLDKAEIKELEESMAMNGAADIQSADAENAVTLSAFAHLDEKKILRKMDWHIIPVLTILYLFSFLDRE